MANKEARLILSLIDQVSGPARGIVGSLKAVNTTIAGMKDIAMAPTRALDTMARDMRRRVSDMTAMSAGMTYGMVEMAKQVYELQRQLNISEAAGDINVSERQALMKEAIRLNGIYAATSTEIVGGANEVLKAGMSFDQTMGSLTGILDTAQAMGVPIADASAAIVNAMVAQRMEMDSTATTMKSSIKMADLYAHAVAETTASLEDFATSGKYFNPVAAAMGMSPDETMAWQVALAKAGIRGSSAGTGLRSAPVSIAAPTKGGRAALAGLGINPKDYVGARSGGATGDSITAALEASGFTAEGIEAAINSLMQDPKIAKSSTKLAKAILDQFGDEMGVQTAQDKALITERIQDAMMSGVSEVDMYGMLKALRDKGAGIGDYAAIFGKNHASKMMAIDPEEYLAILQNIQEKSDGQAARMRAKQMQDIVGDWNQFTAAIEATAIAFGEAGLLADAATGLQKMADALDRIAESNPELLRMGGYAAIALAALAPLGFIISGVASSMALLANPLALVGAGLTYLAVVNWDALTGFFTNFGAVLKENINPEILDHVASGVTAVKDAFAAMNSDGYNAKWAYAAAGSANALASAINKIYDAGTKLANSRFATGFAEGFVIALDRMSAAGERLMAFASSVQIKMQPVLDFLNSEFGADMGKVLGELSGYGVGLAATALGVSMVAGAISKLAGALFLISGAKLGVGVLRSVLGIGAAAGTGAAGAGAGAGAAAAARMGLGGFMAAAGGIVLIAAAIKKYGSRVEVTKPKANTPLDHFNRWKARNLDAAGIRLRQDSFYGTAKDDRPRGDRNGLDRDPIRDDRPRRPRAQEGRLLHPSLMNDNLPAKNGTKDDYSPPSGPSDFQKFMFGAAAQPNFKIREALKIELNGATQDSSAAGTQIKTDLSITVTPNVDSSRIDAAIAKSATLRSMLQGMGSVSVGGGAKSAGPSYGGPRAAGGPVRRGMTYMINERGRETVTMGSNGYVTPAHKVGDGGGVSIGAMHIYGANSDDVAEKVGRRIARELSRSRQLGLDGRPNY